MLFFIVAIFVVPSTLSFGVLGDFKIFNKTIFEMFDFMASNILLTFNTIILCILGGWFLKIKGEMIIKNQIIASCFTFALKYIIPIFLTVLLIAGLV